MTISIHAPLTGRDGRYWQDRISDPYFNPRAPYGARRGRLPRFGSVLHISIHAPLTGRDSMICKRGIRLSAFQSTRPLRGATTYGGTRTVGTVKFQSTRPLRGATQGAAYFYLLLLISIHAPLTGRDELECSTTCAFFNFNPRAPYGARLDVPLFLAEGLTFQSTRPLRGATAANDENLRAVRISIHAPLTGRDQGRRQVRREQRISIHAPLTGRDRRRSTASATAMTISIHAPLTGRDGDGRGLQP